MAMMTLTQVLCPVDLSELSIRALVYAGAVAEWYGSQLAVLHVVPSFEPMEVRAGALFDPVQFAYPMTRDQIEERLRDAVRAAGITSRVTCVAAAGEPAAVIADQTLATTAELIVMATHGRSGWQRLMLGSVTEKVLQTAPCAVLTVPPDAPGSPRELAGEVVLCPVDYSPASLQAAGFAVDIARQVDAEVKFVQAIEWLAEEEPREIAHFSVPEFRRALMQQADEELHRLIAELPKAPRGATATVTLGRAHREILRLAADAQARLIVMGARGRGAPGLAALGSTTLQVVRAAGCPVLTVRA
jgi:nucleotide-binding universal stress UspA family protein